MRGYGYLIHQDLHIQIDHQRPKLFVELGIAAPLSPLKVDLLNLRIPRDHRRNLPQPLECSGILHAVTQRNLCARSATTHTRQRKGKKNCLNTCKIALIPVQAMPT